MKIQDIFVKDINRDIQAVIKAEQHDEAIRYTELDEFVLTGEGAKQLKIFLAQYHEAITGQQTETGVWIAGFFGSGKSHFMKIIGYLLENEPVRGKTPLEFLQSKTDDQELQQLMADIVTAKNEIITFNISSKSSTQSNQRQTNISEILYNQFNAMLGLSETARIAFGEWQLINENMYESFKAAIQQEIGKSWEEVRPNYILNLAAINQALATIGHEDVTAKDLFDRDFDMTTEQIVDLFIKYANEDDNRILSFLVDEVSQYIGANSQLILELQTLVEQMGSKGHGKVWMVVTSQKRLNDVTQTNEMDDYSKIQARFATRIDLTSANTDEVIKKRLLEKTPEAQAALTALYQQNEQLLKTTLAFKTGTTKFAGGYKDCEQFVQMYPLVPYQIDMLQQVFEKIREQGEGGASTSRGERTILKATQLAIRNDNQEELGNLVTMAEYYPAIAEQLDSMIIQTMTLATEQHEHGVLTKNDLDVLHLTYFFRGLDTEVQANLDNFTVMSLPDINATKKQVSEELKNSLNRLTHNLFVADKGDETFEFITSEERKANESIQTIKLDSSVIEAEIKTNYFNHILPSQKRAFKNNQSNFNFDSYFDGVKEGNSKEFMRIETYSSEENYRLSEQDGTIQIYFAKADEQELYRLSERKLKLDEFIKQQRLETTTTDEIIARKRTERDELGKKLIETLKSASERVSMYANDVAILKNKQFDARLEEAKTQIFAATYSEFRLVSEQLSSTKKDFQAKWREMVTTGNLIDSDLNVLAQKRLLDWLTTKLKMSRQLPLNEIVTFFQSRPYGWELRDIIYLLLILQAKKQIKILTPHIDQKNVEEFIIALENMARLEHMHLELVHELSSQDITAFKNAVQTVFLQGVRESISTEDDMQEVLLKVWQEQFEAKLGEIQQALYAKVIAQQPLKQLEQTNRAFKALKPANQVAWFLDNCDDLGDTVEQLDELLNFVENQTLIQQVEQAQAFMHEQLTELQAFTQNSDIEQTLPRFQQLLGMIAEQIPGMQQVKELESTRYLLSESLQKQISEAKKQTTFVIEHLLNRFEQDLNREEPSLQAIVATTQEAVVALVHQIQAQTKGSLISNYQLRAQQLIETARNQYNQEIERLANVVVVEQPKASTASKPVAVPPKPTTQCDATEVINTLFAGHTKIESEAELDQALAQLREHLAGKLKTGVLIRKY